LENISIIVPCRNEINYIKNFLDSIKDQDFSDDLVEVIIVDGMSDDGTYEYLMTSSFINLVVLQNPAKYVSNAMNLGIRVAKGQFIVRMDVHSIFPKNYLSTLINHSLKHPQIGNVGVPCKTLPSSKSPQSRAIALALSSPLGVGNSDFRIRVPKGFKLVDTVPFGCWRRDIFNKVGYFDEELIRNQDDEFNQRILSFGLDIHLIPSPEVIYYGRQDFKSHAKMFYQYGLFKPLVNKKISKITTLRQLAPMGLILYFFLMLITTAIYPQISILMLSFFLFGYIFSSIVYFYSINQKINLILYFILAILIAHISYGIGYWKGLLFGVGSKEISVSR
jgi:glycosyltransferase involved in cell wall biosynthesis